MHHNTSHIAGDTSDDDVAVWRGQGVYGRIGSDPPMRYGGTRLFTILANLLSGHLYCKSVVRYTGISAHSPSRNGEFTGTSTLEKRHHVRRCLDYHCPRVRTAPQDDANQTALCLKAPIRKNAHSPC